MANPDNSLIFPIFQAHMCEGKQRDAHSWCRLFSLRDIVVFPFVAVRIMCSTLSKSLSLLPELPLAHSHSSSHLIPRYTTNSNESPLLSVSQSVQADGVVLMWNIVLPRLRRPCLLIHQLYLCYHLLLRLM